MHKNQNETSYEVTFCLVKPHAYSNRHDVRSMILGNGLDVVAEKYPYTFTPNVVDEQYFMHREKPFFGDLMSLMTEGPASIMVIYGDRAISRMIELAGNTDARKAEENTIRRKYGINASKNALHRSDSRQSAMREINLHWTREEQEKFPTEVLKILEIYADEF